MKWKLPCTLTSSSPSLITVHILDQGVIKLTVLRKEESIAIQYFNITRRGWILTVRTANVTKFIYKRANLPAGFHQKPLYGG